jgi:hypothetical protein
MAISQRLTGLIKTSVQLNHPFCECQRPATIITEKSSMICSTLNTSILYPAPPNGVVLPPGTIHFAIAPRLSPVGCNGLLWGTGPPANPTPLTRQCPSGQTASPTRQHPGGPRNAQQFPSRAA